MEELKCVHFRPLISGNFVLEGLTYKGLHLEKELSIQEVESSMLTQYYLDKI